MLWRFERLALPYKRTIAAASLSDDGPVMRDGDERQERAVRVVDACKPSTFLGVRQRAFASVLCEEVPTDEVRDERLAVMVNWVSTVARGCAARVRRSR